MNKIVNLKQPYGFKFAPLQFVTVNIFGIKLDGRVQKCILLSGNVPIYEIEYLDQGLIQNKEFWENELEERK